MENICHMCNAEFKDSNTLSEHKNMCNVYCHNFKKCVEGTYDNENLFPTEDIHIWHVWKQISKEM